MLDHIRTHFHTNFGSFLVHVRDMFVTFSLFFWHISGQQIRSLSAADKEGLPRGYFLGTQFTNGKSISVFCDLHHVANGHISVFVFLGPRRQFNYAKGASRISFDKSGFENLTIIFS